MTGDIALDEARLAGRNHAMPLEALRYAVTPVGLHYLLIHFDIPMVDPDAWRLEVDGAVDRPLSLALSELTARKAVTAPVTFECAGNGRALLTPRPLSQPWLTEGVGTAEWTGVPLGAVLAEAGLRPGALDVVFTGLDRGIEGDVEQEYQRALPLDEAQRDDVLLAFAMNGAPLLPQHGFPLRVVVPGWYGMTNVKWLRRVTVLSEPFRGFQHDREYRVRSAEDDAGTPVTRMLPRSLMLPPGIPEFMTRTRYLAPGTCALRGRAWSGWGPIVRVEVSGDGGRTWGEAHLDDPAAAGAWHAWTFEWDARPGTHDLCSRATDASGRTQPLAVPWNVGGYANNGVQHVTVVVR